MRRGFLWRLVLPIAFGVWMGLTASGHGAERREFPGGMYADALTTGEFVVGYTGALETHLGKIPTPPRDDFTMFNRITAAGRFRIASKSHTSDRTWVWDQGWREDGRVSHGVQGLIWDPSGTLHVFEPCRDCESQGYRYWGPSGPVMGSPTYNPFTNFARQLGVTRLYEWTRCGDVTIGQGDQGGAIIQYQAKHYLLEPGDARFIQFHCAGNALAVAITKLRERAAVIHRLTVGEIAALPAYGVPTAPEPAPAPAPVPAPAPAPAPVECGHIPAVGQNVLRELAAAFPALIRSASDDDRRRWALMAAEQMAFSVSPSWGTKKASQGRPQSKDGVAKFVGVTLCTWDVVNGNSRELQFGRGEAVPDQVFIPVTPRNHLGTEPAPEPEPEPDPDLLARLDKLEARVSALASELAAVHEHVSALEARPGVPVEQVRALIDAAFAGAIATGNTSREFFHGHKITLQIQRAPQ